ncbi:hypothetical protein, partial [Jutongia sp.]|uniref:hypothetical protein n=1 Tax=Jutongia sp. TaxID=2944204 RepID=UPI00307AA6B6
MVGKIIKGSSSGQCAGYCLNHDNAEILCWQGLDIDFIQAETLASSEGRERLTLAREMALNISRSFDEQASLNPAVDKPGCILFEYGFLRDLFTLHRISEPSVKVIIPAICRRNLRQRSVLLHNYIQRITGSACRVKGHQEAPVLVWENG